ncbi:hypothetical protein pb186bvf_003905 [Paramecium bursaria]
MSKELVKQVQAAIYKSFKLTCKEEYLSNKLQLYQINEIKSYKDPQFLNILKDMIEDKFETYLERQQDKLMPNHQYLFEILAAKNLNEPELSKYTNTNTGMVQFVLSPNNVIAIELEKLNDISKELTQMHGIKVLILQIQNRYW